MKKIPGNCKCCGAPLSKTEMARWVRVCELLGEDPVAEALRTRPPGIGCDDCANRNLAERLEDGDQVARTIVRRLQIQNSGLRLVKASPAEQQPQNVLRCGKTKRAPT